MELDYVTIEHNGPVALVTFDRKKNLNAFDGKLILELTEVARSFQEDLDTRAVVLTGSKQYFSAGADLEDLGTRAALSELARRQSFYRGVRLCEAWEAMPQITIAAMEKIAVGAGVALPLACDWRVMGEGAFLYVPEARSLSDLSDRREPSGRARTVFHDFEAHSGTTQRKSGEKWTALPTAQ